jgi:endonuclease/exonuclease/phosphatase family metal-dependent hydrolase
MMKEGIMTTNVFAKTTATIAAWNLSTFEPLDDNRIKRQAIGLRMLDAELVTLVEIKNESHIRDIAQHLTETGVFYEYSFLEQAQTDHGHDAMHIGVLFKKGVSVTNPYLLPGSDLGNNNLRKAFVCDVSIGKFDFKLIAVHLKSGRGTEEQKVRDDQCKVIGQFITELRGDQDRNPDILLMGDFNMIPGQDISNFHHLGGDDIMDFVSSWDLQERYSHILPSGRENLLDGFAISRRYSTEYIKGSLRLFAMHWNMELGQAKYREEVSDHLPFVASFEITRGRTD